MRRLLCLVLCLTFLIFPVQAAQKNEKYVALTFDDGPSGRFTRRLLDGLAERDAKATFFLCGYRAGVGYIQDLRTGFLCRNADFDPYELYRDYFLYHERVFSGGKSNENPLHAAGSIIGNVSGNDSKYFPCGII